jgi:hypothetical protein
MVANALAGVNSQFYSLRQVIAGPTADRSAQIGRRGGDDELGEWPFANDLRAK